MPLTVWLIKENALIHIESAIICFVIVSEILIVTVLVIPLMIVTVIKINCVNDSNSDGKMNKIENNGAATLSMKKMIIIS